MNIRALVADGQPLASEQMVSMLSEEADVEVVGIADSGAAALDALQQLAPNLVFLNPQLPVLNGFGVIAAIGVDRMPPTILVASHDEYALRAFEVHAIDYLVRPLSRSRLRSAIARARERLESNEADRLAHELLGLVEELRTPVPVSPRLMVRNGGRVVLLDEDQIDWVEADGNYVRLHVGSEAYLTRETLASLHARLRGDRFFRIHRSCAVRLDRIKEIRIGRGRDYEVGERRAARRQPAVQGRVEGEACRTHVGLASLVGLAHFVRL
jgi:two-component system LytT family response regulator